MTKKGVGFRRYPQCIINVLYKYQRGSELWGGIITRCRQRHIDVMTHFAPPSTHIYVQCMGAVRKLEKTLQWME